MSTIGRGVASLFAMLLAVVEAIEAAPTDGETPVTRIDLLRVRVERRQ